MRKGYRLMFWFHRTRVAPPAQWGGVLCAPNPPRSRMGGKSLSAPPEFCTVSAWRFPVTVATATLTRSASAFAVRHVGDGPIGPTRDVVAMASFSGAVSRPGASRTRTSLSKSVWRVVGCECVIVHPILQ